MATAVAPAVGTAFGTSAVASMAAAPVFTAAAAAPIASAGASMMMKPAILSPGGAGFFSTLGSTFSNFLNRPLLSTELFGDFSLKQLGYAASTGMSIMQQIQQGQMQKSLMQVENAKLQAELARKKLNYQMDALQRMKAMNAANSTLVANRYAGGVYGLDGSAKLLEIVNQQEYGQDYKTAMMNIENEILSGNVQSDIFKATGDAAVRDSYLSSAAKFGEAVYMYDRLGFPGRTV
jgi:hypothetical protein